MPGPVDPARLLVAELKAGATDSLAGVVAGIKNPTTASAAVRPAARA
jgi:predicted N-acetyltransferase YhbS